MGKFLFLPTYRRQLTAFFQFQFEAFQDFSILVIFPVKIL